MLLSLKSKLLAAISAIVILTGLAIAGIVIQRYSGALRQEMMGQSENLAHGIALDAADRILINDLVGLQKMLDQQRRIQPALAYLFILKDGQVLAHTFDQGLPAGEDGARLFVHGASGDCGCRVRAPRRREPRTSRRGKAPCELRGPRLSPRVPRVI